jgi:hypothetical protein
LVTSKPDFSFCWLFKKLLHYQNLKWSNILARSEEFILPVTFCSYPKGGTFTRFAHSRRFFNGGCALLWAGEILLSKLFYEL